MSEKDQLIENLAARIESLEVAVARMDSLEAAIAEIDDDIPDSQVSSYPADMDMGANYLSYFKVYDASSGVTYKLGVKDGSPVSPLTGYCGRALINGTGKWVATVEQTITETGDYSAYLLCWVDETEGKGCEVIIAAGVEAPTDPVVASPANILAYTAILLGRWSVTDPGGGAKWIVTPNQDYLRGGDAQVLVLGPCGDDVEIEI